MSRVTRASFICMAGLFVFAAVAKMAGPLVVILFSYLVLTHLNFTRNKPLTIALFLTLVAVLFYGFANLMKAAITVLPNLVSTSIPAMVEFAAKHNLVLPFNDLGQVKAVVMEKVSGQLGPLGDFAKLLTTEFAFFIISLVVAICLFLKPKLDLEKETHAIPNNLYAAFCEELSKRFWMLYECFSMVMGAQLIIACINAALTAVFVVSIQLKHSTTMIGLTLFCGIFPIVGNLVSNTIIVCVAFQQSPEKALLALIFLVVLHKLEYLLNSKIIGDRIKSPMWLTLLGLLIGERLMGIPGMILAPVVLNYLRAEGVRIKVLPQPVQEAKG